MLKNREEAGELLANKLIGYSNNKDAVIVAIPRGALPIGAIIAQKLNVPLEIVLSKKIGHPLNKEFAIGTVTLKNYTLNDDVIGISDKYIKEEIKRIRAILKKRHQLYYESKKPLSFKDKIIILIDDGVATGSTLLSCIELIQKENPAEIIIALPVASNSAYTKIKRNPFVNRLICLHIPQRFNSVGQFYEKFNQVTDDEVVKLLNKTNKDYWMNILKTQT